MLINLVGSMKRRCELIIENNGERISYELLSNKFGRFYFSIDPLFMKID